MRSLNKIWSRIELPVIYSTLIIFFALQILSLILKNSFIDNMIEGRGIFIFFTVILFFLILFIDRRISTLRKYDSVSYFSTFDEAIEYVFKQQRKIKELYILGHSTNTIYEHIKWKLHGNENLRILIRNPNSSNFLKHLKTKQAKRSEKEQIKSAVNNWKDKFTNKEIKNLDIYYYDFEPSFYLIIIDEKMGILGIFEPCQRGWGYDVETAIVIDGRNEVGKLFLNDLIGLFNSIIKYKSSQLNISPNG